MCTLAIRAGRGEGGAGSVLKGRSGRVGRQGFSQTADNDRKLCMTSLLSQTFSGGICPQDETFFSNPGGSMGKTVRKCTATRIKHVFGTKINVHVLSEQKYFPELQYFENSKNDSDKTKSSFFFNQIFSYHFH